MTDSFTPRPSTDWHTSIPTDNPSVKLLGQAHPGKTGQHIGAVLCAPVSDDDDGAALEYATKMASLLGLDDASVIQSDAGSDYPAGVRTISYQTFNV